MKRASKAITARALFQPRCKMWITLPLIEKMFEWGKQNKGFNRLLMLFSLSYVFMLRLPSEALPMVVGPLPTFEAQSILVAESDKLTLHLKRRKNRPLGGKLCRECWCSTSASTCPVHVLGKSVSRVPPGTAMFSNITGRVANQKLRYILEMIKVADAQKFRSHDLRRGHALDMQKSGM